MIHAQGLRHAFGRTVVLDGVDITVPARGVVGLIGPNGSGKTTTLKALYRALNPQEGTVLIDGEELSSLGSEQRAAALAVVGQDSHGADSAGDSFGTDLTVAELVALARTRHTSKDLAAVDAALARCGLGDVAGQPLSALSGGQRQRAFIARGLAQGARYLLLDEPTNHLDPYFQHQILRILRDLDAGVIIVLHDLNLAYTYCDEVVVLDAGAVAAAGSATAVLIPDILSPIYGLPVHRVHAGGGFHLVLGEGAPQ